MLFQINNFLFYKILFAFEVFIFEDSDEEDTEDIHDLREKIIAIFEKVEALDKNLVREYLNKKFEAIDVAKKDSKKKPKEKENKKKEDPPKIPPNLIFDFFFLDETLRLQFNHTFTCGLCRFWTTSANLGEFLSQWLFLCLQKYLYFMDLLEF
jgi:hypothetical protein